MSRCTWLICERTDRWRRAVDRFAPAMLPGGFELVAARAEEVRQSPQHAVGLIMLYELDSAGPQPVLQSLALCASRSPALPPAIAGPLQIVALAPDLRLDALLRARLTAALRQIGATAVLRHPEQLPHLGQLIARYARACGPGQASRP